MDGARIEILSLLPQERAPPRFPGGGVFPGEEGGKRRHDLDRERLAGHLDADDKGAGRSAPDNPDVPPEAHTALPAARAGKFRHGIPSPGSSPPAGQAASAARCPATHALAREADHSLSRNERAFLPGSRGEKENPYSTSHRTRPPGVPGRAGCTGRRPGEWR